MSEGKMREFSVSTASNSRAHEFGRYLPTIGESRFRGVPGRVSGGLRADHVNTLITLHLYCVESLKRTPLFPALARLGHSISPTPRKSSPHPRSLVLARKRIKIFVFTFYPSLVLLIKYLCAFDCPFI